MNIFFVYDTSYCNTDEDDPKDALIYLYPPQAIESDYYFLCCQLAGVAKFLKTSFSSPSIISLERGKFAFLWSDKYLLALGSKLDVNSNVLQDQLSFLSGIFCFYHQSLSNVFQECKNRKEFIEKLEIAWSRYVALSQCFGNVLQLSLNAQLMKSIKKSASNIIKANRLLHMCQMNSSVVAGAIFSNSRIVSSQFTPEITSYLCLMSNSNASAPVSNIPHNFDKLPMDVELKCVYLSSKNMASILKYNHLHVGTRIRVKSMNHSISSNSNHSNSGSEGDVDSETPKGFVSRSSRFMKSKKQGSSFLKYLQCGSSCCELHLQMVKRRIRLSKNRNCLLVPHELDESASRSSSEKHSLSEYYRCKSLSFGMLQNICNAVELVCKKHSLLIAEAFVSPSKLHCKNTPSSHFNDFFCPFCKNNLASEFNPLAIKRWNSDIELNLSPMKDLSNKHSKVIPERQTLKSTDSPKLQVLKCRAHSVGHNTFRHIPNTDSTLKRQFRSTSMSSSHSSFTDKNNMFHFSSGKEKFESMKENEVKKHVLYVQRYASGTLLLLLNNHYDGNALKYLWNCGFTVLRDIDQKAANTLEGNVSCYIEPSFYILLYNNDQKTLREFPHHPFSILNEKHSSETMQHIQEDFQSHKDLQALNLLSSNQSMFATQKDEHFVFYLQPEKSSRKIESLFSLSQKAIRRIEKYFDIAF